MADRERQFGDSKQRYRICRHLFCNAAGAVFHGWRSVCQSGLLAGSALFQRLIQVVLAVASCTNIQGFTTTAQTSVFWSYHWLACASETGAICLLLNQSSTTALLSMEN